jgi:hypothetical protein
MLLKKKETIRSAHSDCKGKVNCNNKYNQEFKILQYMTKLDSHLMEENNRGSFIFTDSNFITFKKLH